MPEHVLWPVAVYFGFILALVALVLAASSVLGERHSGGASGEPFESGIQPVQPARIRFSVKFYVVGMLFVIFDLETVYLVSWAVIAREAGWAAFIEAAIFIAVLLAALAYLWKIGALEWGTPAQPIVRGRRNTLPPGRGTGHPPRSLTAAEPEGSSAQS